MPKDPQVSVIITTRNESEVLPNLLQSLEKQSYKNIEIIVVDNKSSDKTKGIARKFTEKVYDYGPERSAQRNYGAKNAGGRYLLFLDADMELTKEVINECVKTAKNNKGIAMVVIPEVSVSTNFWEKVKSFERSFYNLEGDEEIEAARFFSKKVFNELNGYDETITGPEDWDLPERIKRKGYKQRRIKSKIKHHERIPSLFSVAKKKYYYALTSHRYLKKHKIPLSSSKTIYFLRPTFYRNWKRIFKHPLLGLSMILMLSVELVFGGVGYLIGRFRNK